MKSIFYIKNIKNNIFPVDISFNFSFKDIFILKFINFYFRNDMTF